MNKKAFLAALALSLALTATACGPDQLTKPSSSGQEKTNTDKSDVPVSSSESGTRLVSVDNVEKYIKIAQYKGLNLDNTMPEITDEQVDAFIEHELKDARELLKDLSEPIQEGDLVTMNYTGILNGKTIESEHLYDVIVGEGGMIEGFEEALIGLKKGDTETILLTLPDDFYQKELSGSTVAYHVSILGIMRAPKLTDEWVSVNSSVKTVAEYRELVRQRMKDSMEAEAQDNLRSLAWDIVLTNSEVMEFPKADMETAMDEFRTQVMKYNNEGGMDLESFVESQGMTMEGFEEQCRQYAESKVKQNLIIQGIMDAEGIRLDDAESLTVQEQLAADFGASSLAQLIDSYGQTMIDEAIGLLRVEDFIVANAVIESDETEGEQPDIVDAEAVDPSEEGTEGE